MLETIYVHTAIEQLLKEKRYDDFVKAFYCFFFLCKFSLNLQLLVDKMI